MGKGLKPQVHVATTVGVIQATSRLNAKQCWPAGVMWALLQGGWRSFSGVLVQCTA